jgi:hypothetical protein
MKNALNQNIYYHKVYSNTKAKMLRNMLCTLAVSTIAHLFLNRDVYFLIQIKT